MTASRTAIEDIRSKISTEANKIIEYNHVGWGAIQPKPDYYYLSTRTVTQSCLLVSLLYQATNNKKLEIYWLEKGIEAQEQSIDYTECCLKLSSRISKEDPEQAARLLYQSWPYLTDASKKTEVITLLIELSKRTTASAQVALANIHIQEYQERKVSTDLQVISEQIINLKNNYHLLPDARIKNLRNIINSTISLEDSESKDPKLHDTIHVALSTSWNLHWKAYSKSIKNNSGILTNLFSKLKRPSDSEMNTIGNEHNAAVALFFKEDKSDKHFLDASFSFKKIAENVLKYPDKASQLFAAKCIHLAAIAHSQCSEKKETYLTSASELYMEAHRLTVATKSKTSKIIKSICDLAPSIIALRNEVIFKKYTNHLLKCLTVTIGEENLGNLQRLDKTLTYLINANPLLNQQFFWLGIINEIADSALKITNNKITDCSIKLLSQFEAQIIASPHNDVKLAYHNKLADLLAKAGSADHIKILEHRRQAVALAGEEKVTTPAKTAFAADLNKKHANALINAGSHYRTTLKPSEAKAAYEYARDTYNDTRAYLGLAKLTLSSSEATPFLLQALDNAHSQKNADQMNEAMKDTLSLLLPLANTDPDRETIEKGLHKLYEANFLIESKKVENPTAAISFLSNHVHQWLKPGARCPISTASLNKILMLILNSPYKKDVSLLRLIGDYSLQRTAATKDEIARQCHLKLSEQTSISLTERRTLLGRVVALDTKENLVSNRIAQLNFIISNKNKTNGLLIILENARENKIDDSDLYIEGINQWIEGPVHTMTTPSYEFFARKLMAIAIQPNNLLAVYAAKALNDRYIQMGDIQSLSLAILLSHEKCKLSKESVEAHQEAFSLCEKMLRIRRLDHYVHLSAIGDPFGYCEKLLKYMLTLSFLKDDHFKIQGILDREKIYFAISQSYSMPDSQLIAFGKKDMLPALIYLAEQYQKTSPISSVLLSIKIYILTLNKKNAADRYQLSESEIAQANRDAFAFISKCANDAKTGLQEIALFGLQLFANRQLPEIMMDSKITAEQIIAAALSTNTRLWNQISTNTVAFNTSIASLSDIADRLGSSASSSTVIVDEQKRSGPSPRM